MKLNLWHKVVIAILLGIIAGNYLTWLSPIVEPLANIYINLVKMIVIPTVFCAILYGITNISDTSLLGRLGKKSIYLYLGMTIFAVSLGIIMTLLFKPGVGVVLNLGDAKLVTAAPFSFKALILEIFPQNPIRAMAESKTLQVVFFAFILGISLILVGEKGKLAREVIASATSGIFKMVELVVRFTPYGVFALMVSSIQHYGFSALLNLSKLAGLILLAFLIQYLSFGLIILCFKLNPLPFYRKTLNVQSLAFATSSSKATISSAIKDLQTKLGVSSTSANFILPLGAAINMTGSAIYITVCVVFLAQSLGIELSIYQYFVLVLTSTIGSIGAAGYPSGAVIILGMVLTAMGLPDTIIPLVMGIDRILDMFRTVVNVTGDCVATLVIDHLEGGLDREKYEQ